MRPPVVRDGRQDAKLALLVKNDIEDFAAAKRLPSLAYAVAKGSADLTGAIGAPDISSPGMAATDRSVYHLASLAKPVVAAAVMQLAERGVIRLDDPVHSHLPYFRIADQRYQEITVRHLLLHMSGLPDVEDYGWETPDFDDGALERYVRSLGEVKLQTAPGTVVSYSNMGYEILGDLVAKKSGETFEGYVAKNIFSPLQMTNSTFLLQSVPASALAKPYKIIDGAPTATGRFPYNRSHAPSSTLYSCASDMLHWLRLFLDGAGGKSVLSAESKALMLADEANRQVDIAEEIAPGQGIGWSSITIDGVRLNGHGGHDEGFKATMMFVPAASAGLVLMTNGDSEEVDLDGFGLKLLGKLVDKDWSRFSK